MSDASLPQLSEISQKMLKAFFDTLPKTLEPVLLLNNKGELGEGGERFNLNIFNSDSVPDERVTLILEVIGFLFCPDHDDTVQTGENAVGQSARTDLENLTSDDIINSIRSFINLPEDKNT